MSKATLKHWTVRMQKVRQNVTTTTSRLTNGQKKKGPARGGRNKRGGRNHSSKDQTARAGMEKARGSQPKKRKYYSPDQQFIKTKTPSHFKTRNTWEQHETKTTIADGNRKRNPGKTIN